MRFAGRQSRGLEAEAATLIAEAERKGMEISAAKFALREVRQVRMEARTVVHAFDPSKFREVAQKGIGAGLAVRDDARAAIREFYFRRTGLGVATLIITVLAISLFLTIRKIERRQRERYGSPNRVDRSFIDRIQQQEAPCTPTRGQFSMRSFSGRLTFLATFFHLSVASRESHALCVTPYADPCPERDGPDSHVLPGR